MTDTVSLEVRSKIMAKVKSTDTKPEMIVRRMIHSLGYRYRLHRPDLPGRPDLVFPSRRKVIFVNGCFWHNHTNCAKVRIPETNREYWVDKIERNSERDKRNLSLLQESGWQAETVWECQLKDLESLKTRIIDFLG